MCIRDRYTFFCQFLNDVTECFGLQLTFQKILLPREVRLQVFVTSFEHRLFAFQKL